jgi:hypothetical protein
MLFRTFASLLFCCLLTSVSVLAQSDDEKAVAGRVEMLRQVMVKPDKTILEDLAADELEYVHSSGTVRNKAGFVDEFMKGWSVFTAITLQDQTIKIAGTNAIVRHRLLGDTNKPGMPPKIDIIILMVWHKENGKWKLLARQAAKIPPAT